MAKSGNITIKVGPAEVKHLLANPRFVDPRYRNRYYGDVDRNVLAKVYKAVAARFTEVSAAMDEELRAREIVYGARDSEGWREQVTGEYYGKKKLLDEQYSQINIEHSERAQRFIQAKFDEAGIVNFVASGHGSVDRRKSEDGES